MNSVLPSLRGMKDDLLLRELLRRWLNYDAIIMHLSKIFCYLNEECIPKYIPFLEEISFSSFKRLAYEAMNKEIMDAIFSVMERKLTGEKIDPTFLINTLDFYLKFYKWTEKDNAKDVLSSKKIKLISSNDVTFEVDYRVLLMSKKFEEITVGDVNTISVPKMSSKMLDIAVEYYKKLIKHS
ncbi:cullin-1-like protein [Trifolium pratense]|uniref:Cullin-1-like protein n=1 Tax=Trifolium pratense TaxID=57577 RepID=A0A2K3MZT6_TRIPR|nr:cullin-1-like protein [Trifolium pratense]